jgi:hypothetical protein
MNTVQVMEDEEVMGWYEEVQACKHPDKKQGWPVLHDIA